MSFVPCPTVATRWLVKERENAARTITRILLRLGKVLMLLTALMTHGVLFVYLVMSSTLGRPPLLISITPPFLVVSFPVTLRPSPIKG